MSEDDILESNFHAYWPGIHASLEREVQQLTTLINNQFDQVRYAGISDLELSDETPFSIDLRGVQDRIPYTITLNPGKQWNAINDQFWNESQRLVAGMTSIAGRYRLLAGAVRLDWVRPIKTTLVLPPTTEELIKFSGLSAGFYTGDIIEHPVAWIGGRVIVGKVLVS
jgi:hypothetical protein